MSWSLLLRVAIFLPVANSLSGVGAHDFFFFANYLVFTVHFRDLVFGLNLLAVLRIANPLGKVDPITFSATL